MMCFFEQHRFSCGDYKWGNFRMHCNREYHIGETCGMRLVNNTIEQLERCKYCQKADTKLRKREAEANRVVRWQREGRDSASIQRRMDIIRKLDAEISQIYSQIARFRTTPGGHVQHPLKCGEDPSAGQSDGPVVMEMGAKLARKISTAKEHFGLPVTFGALESPLTFMSCPDTGSYVNAISLELASYLGLSVEFSEMELQMRTQLANGKWISSCGHIIAACTLDSLVPDTYFTIIYVFQTLASPGLFFGKQFLEESQARARNLLRKLPWYSSIPRVRSTGSPMHLLSCSLNGIPIGVFPDTGSEVDLMSQEYAEKHFKLEPTPRDTKVEYADGSIEEVFWVVRADLAVGFEPPVYERPREMKNRLANYANISMSCVKGPPTEIEESNQNAFQTNNNKIQIGERRPVIESLFHVVPNLTSEVLLGEASLNALQAYELNAEDFIEVPENQNHPCLNRIVFHPGSMLKKCKSQVRRILGTRVQDNAGDEEAQVGTEALVQDLDNRDQREIDRRELEEERISQLTGQDKQDAEIAEAERQRSYNEQRSQLRNPQTRHI